MIFNEQMLEVPNSRVRIHFDGFGAVTCGHSIVLFLIATGHRVYSLVISMKVSARTRAAGDISVASGVSPWYQYAKNPKPPQGGGTRRAQSSQ